jgi:hypothetical protein
MQWYNGGAELRKSVDKRFLVLVSAVFVTVVLSMQLLASTAWTADAANAGPSVVILQLSNDEDTDWAVEDLVKRLSKFIHDDTFLPDRLVVRRTNDPHEAESIKNKIIIYVSHGGPLGIVTGERLTSWSRMARIVENSPTSIHLFAACYSKNIVRHGNRDSGKSLYTVIGARPAEVTNVEITTTVMLAFGLSPEYIEQYRTTELTRSKSLIQSGESVHMMDFEEIILNEIEAIDGSYNSTYTDDRKVYREAVEVTYSLPGHLCELPADLLDAIDDYFRFYVDSDGIDAERNLEDLYITYIKNYYINSTYFTGEGEGESLSLPPTAGSVEKSDLYSELYSEALLLTEGYWANSTPVFTGGTYSGWIFFAGDGHEYLQVVVNVTASGPTLDNDNKTIVDAMSLQQIDAGGTYYQNQKIDGQWQEPVVGRNPRRSGGSWTDAGVKVDFEYDEAWPPASSCNQASGQLNATDGYLYVHSIPTGSSYHGPSFVRTLPSTFCVRDLGSFSANLSLFHGNDGRRMTKTYIALYDSNLLPVASLEILDTTGYTSSYAGQKAIYYARYYLESGASAYVHSGYIYGDTCGIAQIRFDPHQGIYGNVPNAAETRLYKWTDIDLDRVITYVVIQSYRYTTYPEHDERIYHISVNYAASEYTLFHDTCNDMDEFHQDLDFGYGTTSDGNFTVPEGESYMTLANIPTVPSGWHGPSYVHVLDRPFRLCQLSEFSVIGEIVQTSNSMMGQMHIALFDENKQIVMRVLFGDSWSGTKKAYFSVTFYPQDSSSATQDFGYIYTSFTKSAKLWWGSYPGEEGCIFSSIEGISGFTPLAECDNASRVIKYVVLLGYRYSGYTPADMRIHDIKIVADLKWSQRAFTLLDPCDNMDNFESDDTFGWGVVTDGSIVVPQGQSYMTPTGIPSSPTGWHGPNYVHVIDTPFILHDLRLFSIHVDLLQQSNRMGTMDVALFDTNKECILHIHWGDPYSSQIEGYFHVTYYPEGGSPVSDSTSDIYGSFFRIGELRVEDGVVTYKIKDSQGTLASGSLGEVADPFRQVQYVVLRAQRYSAYDLVDLRLSALNLYAGHETEVEDFESGDGSGEGALGYYESQMSTESKQRVEDALDEGFGQESPYWTGPWPVLHLPVALSVSSSYCNMRIAVDLLTNVAIEEFDLLFGEEQGVPDNDIQETTEGLLSTLDESLGGPLGLWGHALKIGLIAIDMVSLIPVPMWVATLAMLYAAWFVLFAAYVGAMVAAVDLGLLSPGAAGTAFFLWMFVTIRFVKVQLVNECRSAYYFYQGFRLLKDPLWKDLCRWSFVYTVVSIVVKLAAFITSLVLFLYYVGLHVSLYGW